MTKPNYTDTTSTQVSMRTGTGDHDRKLVKFETTVKQTKYDDEGTNFSETVEDELLDVATQAVIDYLFDTFLEPDKNPWVNQEKRYRGCFDVTENEL